MTLLPLMFLGACGGQSGEESVTWGCEPQSETPLAADESTPAGFTATDVATRVTPFDGAFVWAAHDPSTLALTPTVDLSSARWVDYELASSGEGGIEPAMTCADVVELDASVGFATADGLLAETFDWALQAADLGLITAWDELDLDALAGTYTVTEVDLADYDGFTAYVSASWSGQGSFGELTGQATTAGDPSDPDSTASATNVPIATW